MTQDLVSQTMAIETLPLRFAQGQGDMQHTHHRLVASIPQTQLFCNRRTARRVMALQ